MVNIEGLTINNDYEFMLEALAQAHVTIINDDVLRAVEQRMMEMLE